MVGSYSGTPHHISTGCAVPGADIAGKQKAAEGFASSFAPSTWGGIAFRNVRTRTFKIPFVANLVLGPMLLDRLTLPAYPHG